MRMLKAEMIQTYHNLLIRKTVSLMLIDTMKNLVPVSIKVLTL